MSAGEKYLGEMPYNERKPVALVRFVMDKGEVRSYLILLPSYPIADDEQHHRKVVFHTDTDKEIANYIEEVRSYSKNGVIGFFKLSRDCDGKEG